MANYNQLSLTQRIMIHSMIRKNMCFSDVALAIGKDRTTISKEIRRNRYLKSQNRHFDKLLIQKAIDDCPLLSKIPYCCNCCPKLNYCNKRKLFYNPHIAHNHYLDTLKSSRQGVDIDFDTIDQIEHSIIPLIKYKKQSVNQIFLNHKDLLYFSKTTFYKYVDIGLFSIINLDLPKKVVYKKRKNKNKNKRELAILLNRTYDDFCNFVLKHPLMHIVEMDTVIGSKNGDKVLLTIYFRDTHFMLIRLLDKNNISSVQKEFDNFKDILGIKLYSKLFRIILTDNGSEFLNPYIFEYDYHKQNKIVNLFYCDPSCPGQKGGIEKNHEFIRKVLKKGTSFDHFSKSQFQYLENQINNVPRESLKGQTPYELTSQKYPEFISKIGSSYIKPDNVDLSLDSFLKQD